MDFSGGKDIGFNFQREILQCLICITEHHALPAVATFKLDGGVVDFKLFVQGLFDPGHDLCCLVDGLVSDGGVVPKTLIWSILNLL
ncbi:MAG: hypothetical protein DRI56_11770 [Chloroflexota bacterium]|nr:MAG: hypothetical protein DRI56_11770 [Chloroflexota bacterium]